MLETSVKCSYFIFDCVNFLYYKCRKLYLNHVGSYIDSRNWIKNKKATIYPINNEDLSFQYAATAALNN